MEGHRSTPKRKQAEFTEASTPSMSKRPTPNRREELLESLSEDHESESPLLLPSSDLSEKVNVPSASGANSDPSASSTSVIRNNYYVFLSFRGPDTRNGFVDHLYHRLKDVGLPFHPNFVFKDDKDLPFGEDIAANLTSVIKHSKVSIPVISENYAASEWCLHELIQIMECKERGEQKVLPVLYKVKPYEVREQKGAFGKAFESHMHHFKEDVKQQGPVALRKAVAFRIFESEKFADGREAELVNTLVEIVMHQWQEDFQPRLPLNLVGIEDRVAEVMKLVDYAYLDTRIIWIWGMGGVGKTTLATVIYNKLIHKFQCCSFLKNIRETISHKGIEHVQSRLISDILKIRNHPVHDPDRGISTIQSSCTQKKVLILLDDVDCLEDLDKLIGGCSFLLGSRIIVTSRHKAIECQDKAMLEPTYWYELREINSENSFLLFSIHAFEGKPPPKELATLSRNIVATTGGLPLALTVIGSRLKGEKDQRVWGSMLEKLRNAPDKTVQLKLRISYDLLEYEEQQMFLDIACFFIGLDKRIATYLWNDLQYFPIIGLKVLINRSLIEIDDDDDNVLSMHDQLRDLGRAIACPVDKKPWECSRLWDEEAMKVLKRKEENENIEALHLDERGSREFMRRESFKRMPNLKYLRVRDVEFAGDFEESLSELRWLEYWECPDSFKATNVHLEKLLILDFSNGKISENWGGWSSIKMERLKVLDLSYCSHLKSTPDLSAFKGLEMLILEGCTQLEEIDPSIRDVKWLVSLNLDYCENLQELPDSFEALGKLQRLSLRYCNMLKQIPSSIGELGELVELDLSETGIKELPEAIGKLKKLEILRISESKIEKLPSTIGQLESLQELHASRCIELEGEILVHKGGWSSLRTLILDETKISRLPETFHELSTLDHLDLSFCEELESPLEFPSGLSYLKLACRSDTLPSLSHLTHLKELTLDSCKSLQSIPELPPCIRNLHVWGCPELEGFPNLSDLKSLKFLRLDGAKISRLPENFYELSTLEHLQLLDCRELESPREFPSGLSSLWLTCRSDTLPSLSHLTHLKHLTLGYCKSLQSIPELPPCIRQLRVDCCPKLERLPNLSNLKSLSELVLLDCPRLKELHGLEALESLRELDVSRSIGFFGEEVDDLREIPGLGQLKSLQKLDITGRKHIQQLDLSNSKDLKRLIVNNCKTFHRIDFHSSIENLECFHTDARESHIVRPL